MCVVKEQGIEECLREWANWYLSSVGPGGFLAHRSVLGMPLARLFICGHGLTGQGPSNGSVKSTCHLAVVVKCAVRQGSQARAAACLRIFPLNRTHSWAGQCRLRARLRFVHLVFFLILRSPVLSLLGPCIIANLFAFPPFVFIGTFARKLVNSSLSPYFPS